MAALLMDENMPRSAGRLLADAGHEVHFVSDLAPAIDDRGVLALARERRLTLLTFDADFGDLIFQRQVPPPPAVVFLRLHPIDGTVVADMALNALAEPLDGRFVVCTRDARRSRALPVHTDG